MPTINIIWPSVEVLPDGHRLHRHANGSYAIADESGKLPDLTDDGVLWLDFTRPLSVDTIPLTDRNGQPVSTFTNAATALLLSARFAGWVIEVDDIRYTVDVVDE